jgi:hypothetical protein
MTGRLPSTRSSKRLLDYKKRFLFVTSLRDRKVSDTRVFVAVQFDPATRVEDDCLVTSPELDKRHHFFPSGGSQGFAKPRLCSSVGHDYSRRSFVRWIGSAGRMARATNMAAIM